MYQETHGDVMLKNESVLDIRFGQDILILTRTRRVKARITYVLCELS
jgi:hypothetical protein